MKKKIIYVLIHSPLVGRFTWTLIADQMRQRGLDVIVPLLDDTPDSKEPYWKQQAGSFAQAFIGVPKDRGVILIAHSGAGPLLPVIRQAIPNPVDAYVFADAGIPRDGATRLDLMKAEDADWAKEFQAYLESGGRFPNWSSNDLREILPEESVRERLAADLRPRGLDFFTEPIPVFESWPDAPCIYILFSPPYESASTEAREKGWPSYELKADHFHMLVDPKTVTDIIIHAVNELPSHPHE